MHASTIGTASGDEACLIYLGSRIAARVARTLATRTDGIVLRRTMGERSARDLRQFLNYRGPMLFDPAHYERDPREVRVDLASEAARQATLRVAAFLTPSRYVPDGDLGALRDVLDAGAAFAKEAAATRLRVPVLTVLPIRRPWLTKHGDALMNVVGESQQSFVLVLGSRTDPLDSGVAVRGLRKLLDARPGVGLLRSDLASIGALAHGATLVAPGTGTMVRHFIPPGTTGGGVSYDDTPSVLASALKGYFKGSKLELARNRDGGLLDCPCRYCHGRSLTRFGDARLTPEAHRHNAETIFMMFQHFAGSPARLRRTNWAMACTEAVELHQRLSETSGVMFAPSPQLKAWAEWD